MRRLEARARLGDRITVTRDGREIARATIVGLDPLVLADVEIATEGPQNGQEEPGFEYLAKMRQMNDEALNRLFGR